MLPAPCVNLLSTMIVELREQLDEPYFHQPLRQSQRLEQYSSQAETRCPTVFLLKTYSA